VAEKDEEKVKRTCA